jgi:cholesterol transport system auxiliary component
MGSLIRIGLALWALCGCVSLNASYPEKHYYAVEAARSTEPRPSAAQSILKVRQFRISPSYEGKAFVYRLSDARYEADFYNEWFIAPNAMLKQQVLNWLARTGQFRHVTDSSSPMAATYSLEGNVTALYGDYRMTPPRAVLAVQCFLAETVRPADLVLHREYRNEVAVTGTSPEALVAGWSEALRLLLIDLEKDLGHSLNKR